MKVAIARPVDARANTAFEGELRCYDRLVRDRDVDITVVANEGHSLQTEHVDVVTCSQRYLERLHHLWRQGRKQLTGTDRVVMPEFSALGDVVREGDFDVVETSDPTLYPGAHAAYEACREEGTPIVVRASATKHLPNVVPQDETEAVVDYASGFLFVSPMTHDRYAEQGYLDASDNRSEYTGHPVDTDLFSKLDRNSSDGPIVVLSVGVLEERKGYKILAKAVQRLHESDVSIYWDVVGSGELKSWLQTFANRHDFEDAVTLHGQIPHERINEAYASADVFALHSLETPRWEEYFGVAYAEAMSSGLPVVGSDSGTIPWVVRDGVDGKLVSEGSVDGVTEALRTLTTEPDRRQEMGKNGRENVEKRFHIDSVAQSFLDGWRQPLVT
jgi:glycosyltransferase involved in cell wall biosynthesis